VTIRATESSATSFNLAGIATDAGFDDGRERRHMFVGADLRGLKAGVEGV